MRCGDAANLRPLNEIRLQRGGAPSGSLAFEGFTQMLLPAPPNLKPQTAAVGAKPSFRK
jgi:hypothetical protein